MQLFVLHIILQKNPVISLLLSCWFTELEISTMTSCLVSLCSAVFAMPFCFLNEQFFGLVQNCYIWNIWRSYNCMNLGIVQVWWSHLLETVLQRDKFYTVVKIVFELKFMTPLQKLRFSCCLNVLISFHKKSNVKFLFRTFLCMLQVFLDLQVFDILPVWFIGFPSIQTWKKFVIWLW